MQICEPCCRKRYIVLEYILANAPRYMSKCVGCGKTEICLDLNPGYLRPNPRQPEPEKPAKSAGKRKA